MCAEETGENELFKEFVQADGAKEKRKKKAERSQVIAEAKLYCKEVIRKDVMGIISVRAASRIIGVSETMVRQWVKEQRIKTFTFETLRLSGVAARDVLQIKKERDKRIAEKGGKAEEVE